MRTALLLLVICVATSAQAAKAGDPAPDVALVDLAGKPWKLADLRGKVVLVDFWASWCQPCKKELPILDGLARKYAGKAVFVAINVDQERGNAEKLLGELKVATLQIGLDPQGKAAAAFDVPTMPSSYVVGRDGAVRALHAGFEPGDERELAAAVDEALK
jgi:thiol-disulfide isomerase/thioredoxin